MSLITVRQAIQDKLDEVTSLVATFNYEAGKPTGYPYGTVSLGDGFSEFGDSCDSQPGGRNIMTHNFAIKIYQEKEQGFFGAEKAERILTEVMQDVLNKFQESSTLDDGVNYQLPDGYNFENQIGEVNLRVLIINIRAVEIVSAQ